MEGWPLSVRFLKPTIYMRRSSDVQTSSSLDESGTIPAEIFTNIRGIYVAILLAFIR